MNDEKPALNPDWPIEQRMIIAVLYHLWRAYRREGNRKNQIAARRALERAIARQVTA